MSNAIARLELRNFTKFSTLDITFSPKVNIILGENGAGKTHLLKAAYSLCCSGIEHRRKIGSKSRESAPALTKKLFRVFAPVRNALATLYRRGSSGVASITTEFAQGSVVKASFKPGSRSVTVESSGAAPYTAEPIFIPTKEMISLMRGMKHPGHDRKTIELIFDDTYIDLANHLMRSGHGDAASSIDVDPRFGSIMVELTRLMGGRYHWEDGDFRFQRGSYEEKPRAQRSKSAHALMYQDSVETHFVAAREPAISSSMTAEGFKKLGILYRLMSNSTLAGANCGPIFWDEPESNLNPKLMRSLVQTLLELSRNGQQLILATHDYVLLKWFNLLCDPGKGDHVRFHDLSRSKADSGISVESSDDYASISASAISDAFAELYDADVKRALE